MVDITGKLIYFKDDSFEMDGKKVGRFLLTLENENVEKSNQAMLTLALSEELVTKYKLTDPKVIDSFRGKRITVRGVLFDYETVKTDKNGTPRPFKVLKFTPLDLVNIVNSAKE